ncbi:MAG: hypothetical protein KDC53_13850 [Saprospiraceae bacterium]|nr:hypothetical protein [Saprospiraceae bacterium]
MSKITGSNRDPLEDRGWLQMKVLLDQELPERKRRFIWWPWIGAVAAGVVGVLLLPNIVTNNGNTKSLTPSLVMDEQKISVEKQVEMMPLDQSSTNEDHRSQKAIKNSNTTTKPISQLFKNEPIPAGNEERVEVQIKIEKGQEGKANNAFVTELNSEELPDAKPATEIFTQQKSDSVSDVVIYPSLLREIPSSIISPLPYTYLLSQRSKDLPLVHDSSTPVDIRSVSKFDFAINTSIISDVAFHNASFDLGGQIRMKPLRIMSVGLGAFYWRINNSQVFSTEQTNTGSRVTTVDALVANPEMDSNSPGFSNNGSAISYREISQLSYLRVPLFFQFLPERKWQPYLGIQHMILLSDGQQGILESSKQADFATSAPAASSNEIPDLVRLHNSGFILGLTFATHKHWTFDFSVSHSPRSYLNYSVGAGDYVEYHRFFRLGVGYRFNES